MDKTVKKIDQQEEHIRCDCKSCELQNLVFEHLLENELDAICIRKETVVFKKGETVCRMGDEIKFFHYLKTGLVKFYKTNGVGKDQIIRIAKPFDFISLITVFSAKEYQYSVTAIEDSEVCMVPLWAIREIIERNGKFALGIIQKMTQVSDSIITANTDINSKNLRGRIAYILLYFAEDIYKTDQYDLPVSRREIGELIEMSTENVIRMLSEFRKDKLIAIDGKNIKILNKVFLKKLCSFG